MQKFIIQKIDSVPAQALITGQDARHISRVLRHSAGDHITVTNGRGQDFSATITAISPLTVELSITDKIETMTEPPIDITLCSGMLKDKKMDFIIKHVTQLGIYRWIPFFCERSIPSPDEKRLEKRRQRWETIAKESLKQCGRSLLPEISPPVSFNKLLHISADYDQKIAFWENETTPLSNLKKQPSGQKIIILIGPEGGFSADEIQAAEKNGFSSFSLGPRILRAETASIACCTLIQHMFGDI